MSLALGARWQLSGDAARQPEHVKEAFAAGIERLLATLEGEEKPKGAAAWRAAGARGLDAFAPSCRRDRALTGLSR